MLLALIPLLVLVQQAQSVVMPPSPPNLDLWLTNLRGDAAKGKNGAADDSWLSPPAKIFGEALVASAKCTVCDGVVDTLHWIWSQNATKDCVAQLVATVCEALHLQDHYVCQAISGEFKEEVLFVIGKLALQPNQVCGLLLDDCGAPLNPFQSNWTIPIPADKPPLDLLQLPPKGSPTLRILHLSDIHVDFDYVPGSEVNCDDPLCCRRGNVTKEVKKEAGFWGEVGKCDIPLWTLEDMFAYISKNVEFDYIIWTGDLPPHDIWEGNKRRRVKDIQRLTHLFLTHFPNKTVFSAVGNHESLPVDSFPPKKVAIREFDKSWLYNSLAEEWLHWLPNDTESLIKTRASYSVPVRDGLRLISINTQYCDKYNFWIYLNQVDPDETLEWLVSELEEAEHAGEKVHIIGHIPPGDSQCLSGWSKNYYDIVNRFESTIRGQFFGHSHHDSFSLFYEDSDPRKRPTNSLFVGPSVTTFPDLLPAFRVYTVDGERTNSTFSVLNFDTYSLNITTANEQNKTTYEMEYNFKDFYKIKSLFPIDLNGLLDEFILNRSLFQDYVKFYFRQSAPNCDSKCRYEKLCEIRTAKTGTTEDESLCADLPKATLNLAAALFDSDLLTLQLKPKFSKLRDLWQVCRLPFMETTTKKQEINQSAVPSKTESLSDWLRDKVMSRLSTRFAEKLRAISSHLYDRFTQIM